MNKVKLAVILPFRNEPDSWLQRTARSFIKNMPVDLDYRIFCIHDGDDDTNTPIKWIEDEERVELLSTGPVQCGCNVARNLGYEAGVAWGADVFEFSDSHMTFDDMGPKGMLTMVAGALASRCITVTQSKGLDSEESRGIGCELYLFKFTGLQAKWVRHSTSKAEWLPSPCPMGAAYFVSATTANILASATGNLFDATAGTWGFTEGALAIKCWLLSIPILFHATIFSRHCYKTKNPNPGASIGRKKNFCHSMALLLSTDMYNQQFKPLAANLLNVKGELEVSSKVVDIFPDGLNKEREAMMWDKLFGLNPSLDGSGGRGILDEAVLGELITTLESSKQAPKVLVYEPSGAVFALLGRVLRAKITLITTQNYTFRTWKVLDTAIKRLTVRKFDADSTQYLRHIEHPTYVLINGVLDPQPILDRYEGICPVVHWKPELPYLPKSARDKT